MTDRLRRILPGLLLAALILSFFVIRSDDIRSKLSKRDFPDYWAAGRLLLQRQNPYDQTGFLASRNLPMNQALPLRMPPWSLPMLLPLGLLSPFQAWLLWTALSVGSLLFTIDFCWKTFGKEAFRPQFRLMGYVFAPILCCLVVGQIGLVLLLGMVLFLKFEPTRPFVAGIALLLPFAKPHLLATFWLALLIWCVPRKKSWRVAAGLAVAVLSATGIALAFDPDVLLHYAEMLQRVPINKELIPSLPGMLRALFFRREFWVQFVPMALGAAWCIWYSLKNRARWDWHVHGLTVLVVSILTTPYEWFTDEAILLPAILQAAAWIFAAKDAPWANRIALLAFTLLNGFLLLMVVLLVPLRSGLYFWSSLLWFGWYAYGLRRRSVRPGV